ncbi:MAG: DUF4126 domain-containing protein [Gemmatimonadaceae bacterium]|jgi:hypothetical protein|nr:DUF4126 domain-containing protein [Gemmatimonadaceae bacterium]
MLETWIGVLVGIGVAAACGFRIFVPLLALGAASRADVVTLSPTFAVLGSTPALVALATAAVLEVGAYYVPWLDHVLDLAATPTAVIAGTLASAATIVDLPPVLTWGIALIGGGGAAGLLQGATSLLRLKSTATTGGLANPVVATGELAGATVTSALAIFLPVACALLILVAVTWVFRRAHRIGFGRRAARTDATMTQHRGAER